MNTEITDRTMALVTRSGDFWVTPEQARTLMENKAKNPTGFTEIDGCMITVASIESILTAKAYDDYNRKRRGGWKCKYNFWHERFQDCAHGKL